MYFEDITAKIKETGVFSYSDFIADLEIEITPRTIITISYTTTLPKTNFYFSFEGWCYTSFDELLSVIKDREAQEKLLFHLDLFT